MSSKKIVLKVELNCEKCKRRAMKTVVGEPGVESVQVDSKDHKITVIGDADAVGIAGKLRKFGNTDIVSVGPAKEEKKDDKKKEDSKKDVKKDTAKPAPIITYVYVPEGMAMESYGAYNHILSDENPNACAIL